MNLVSAKKALGIAYITMCSSLIFGQTAQEKQVIIKDYDQQKLLEMEQDFRKKEEESKKEAIRIAGIKGWPLVTTTPSGGYAELQAVDADGNPIYYTTSNVDAAKSTRANHLNSGGSLGFDLNGNNMTAYVWDGGLARASHQEYDGAGGSNRFSAGDGSTSLNYHAAHVTGTIIASGVEANAKGMAPYANAVGADWNSDVSEATNAAAAGMLVSNHSYGYRVRDNSGNVLLPAYYFGGYISDSRDWDQLMSNAPYYLMVVAAGNDGNDNSANSSPVGGNSSYDKLTGHATAKNNMVVANANDANIDAAGNLISVYINNSSSEGPTDDLRIKPDITGNGSGVYSTFDSNNSAYGSLTGTSMASPNVTGTLLLLQEHYRDVNGSFMRASTLKGLALHTADDAGTNGPDAVFGWGLLNAKLAAKSISNHGNQSIIEELTLSAGQTYTITVDADGVNDLIASISWTDLPGVANTGTVNLSTPALINDLDIRVSKGGTTYTPWKLTGPTSNTKGDNNVDPYERVDVSNASGTYTITVTHKGSLSGGSQDYALIVTGIQNSTACSAIIPSGISVNAITASSANVTWGSVAGASYTVRYRATGSSAWTTMNGGSSNLTISGLASGTEYEVQVMSTCPDGTNSGFSSSTTFTTVSGQVLCNGLITSFPYYEGFENTLGDWTQNSGDDFDWTVRTGGTPSNNTGPSGANEGNYYIYMESSTPNYSTKNAVLTSPCFDLTGVDNPALNFDYHMYGSNSMGQLHVEASTDGNTWSTIWSKSGNQGNVWSFESVDLSAYTGVSTLKLRFNGTTGTTWRGDMAVDDVSVGVAETSCTDLNLAILLDNYPEETSWEIRNDQNAIVANGGTYGAQADGSLLNIPLCLFDGCYTLTFNDTYGDGICCGYGNGNYSLVNSSTSVILAQGGSFGFSDVTSFCIGSGMMSQYSEQNVSNSVGSMIELYPNPIEDNLYIEHNLTKKLSYKVLDLNGRVLSEGELKNSMVDFSQLSSGVYVVMLTDGYKTKINRVIKK
ncbi:MAG: S8 family serine peptidase [Crocinitomicaceae bacterium]|nr:S8 family serine peptidase [Crocinitomicaceae bacterium]